MMPGRGRQGKERWELEARAQSRGVWLVSRIGLKFADQVLSDEPEKQRQNIKKLQQETIGEVKGLY